MSWSEIKKAVNSNIDVPLDELIKEQVSKPFRNENIQVFVKGYYQNSTVNNRTIFSLTGKARLYGIVAYPANSSGNCTMLAYLNFDNHSFCLSPNSTYINAISNIVCLSDNWRVIDASTGSGYSQYTLYMPQTMGGLTNEQAGYMRLANATSDAPIYTPQQFLDMTTAPFAAYYRSIVISEPIEVEDSFNMVVSTQNGHYANYIVVYELLE